MPPFSRGISVEALRNSFPPIAAASALLGSWIRWARNLAVAWPLFSSVSRQVAVSQSTGAAAGSQGSPEGRAAPGVAHRALAGSEDHFHARSCRCWQASEPHAGGCFTAWQLAFPRASDSRERGTENPRQKLPNLGSDISSGLSCSPVGSSLSPVFTQEEGN